MLLRHKVPTIFNIYMLDVICCALGCVILLWQVSHQEAEDQTAKAKKQADAALSAQMRFDKAKLDLTSASSDVTSLQAAVADWQQKYQSLTQTLATTEKEREEARKLAALRLDAFDQTTKTLALSKKEHKKLEVELANLLADSKKTSAELKDKLQLHVDLQAKMANANNQIALLQGEITLKQAEIDSAVKKSNDQLATLKLTDADAHKLKTLLDKLQTDHKDAQTKLMLTELQLKVREQDLDKMRKDVTLGAGDLTEAKALIAALAKERDQWKEKGLASNAALGTLRLEKDKLSQRVVDLQAEVEQRFAGIPLTGENVVFLIDISGSMKMKDEETDDPEKWPFLCETLMKLMKSIPTLRRFQVILFSDKVTYLFDHDPQDSSPRKVEWYRYEGAKTAKLTHDRLLQVKVEGGTNMHAALDEAFRYRPFKMDTIYLFSDGLPNIGPGVPTSIPRPTEAQRSFYMGKFIRDKLKNDWNRAGAGLNDVRINAVGFFFESPDVGAFLWAMAREHRGSFVGLR